MSISKPRFIITMEDTKPKKLMSVGVDDLDEWINPQKMTRFHRTKDTRNNITMVVKRFKDNIERLEATKK